MAISRVHILKFIELALVIICLGLYYHSYYTWLAKFHEVLVPGTAFGGYLVIMVATFAGIFTGQPINKRIDIFFSLVGCALFIAAGAFFIDHYEGQRKSDDRNIGLATGAMAIINGVIYLVDALLSFRGE